MSHAIHRVKNFEVVGPYRLRIEFVDGLVRTIDFRGVLEGALYGPLRDLATFNAVSLDREVHTIVWPNGADFDPAILHDWPEHEAAMMALAQRWAEGRASEKGGPSPMPKEIDVVHHTDRRRDVVMPYAPAIVVRRGDLVFLSGVTAAAVYHHHPHREEDFDLPATMREQAMLCMENLKKTLESAGATFADLVSATRFLTDVNEQDDLNRVWAAYLGGHLPTTTTVEVSRLATHARCKIEISAIAVTESRT